VCVRARVCVVCFLCVCLCVCVWVGVCVSVCGEVEWPSSNFCCI